MVNLFRLLLGAVWGVFRARRDLLLENLALRQQLAALKDKHHAVFEAGHIAPYEGLDGLIEHYEAYTRGFGEIRHDSLPTSQLHFTGP
jgi:hypothetical protein